MKLDDIAVARNLAESYIESHGGGKISAQLGDGGSAVVFKWDRAGTVYALKVYDASFFKSEYAVAERRRLDLQRRLIGNHCDNIVDILSVEEDLGTCFLTMEYFPGIELKKAIGQVPDSSIPLLIGKLVDAVKFLEGFELVHRDIKPENILVSSCFSELKLLDLGVVREISSDEERTDGTDHGKRRPFIATAQYSSPEYLFRLEGPSKEMWKALTIYQVGGVLHDLVCKHALFEELVASDNKYALAMAVLKETPNFNGISTSVVEWAELAARCLTKDSALRLQLVSWSDFQMNNVPVQDKLLKMLNARSETANQTITDVTRIAALRQNRSQRIASICEALRQKLLNAYTPQIRVAQIHVEECQSVLRLSLADENIGVQLSIVYEWESGLRETFAAIRLAAIASSSDTENIFNGRVHSIGEVNLASYDNTLLLEAIFSATSEILFKYASLVSIGGLGDSTDLIAVTWPNQLNSRED